jgi:predicted DNA-binding transcriptional regulator YafY
MKKPYGESKMRGKNLINLLKSLELLSSSAGTTIGGMEAQLEVDRRSIYRMINLIEDLGFPLYN